VKILKKIDFFKTNLRRDKHWAARQNVPQIALFVVV
jgi:hypothetical protein